MKSLTIITALLLGCCSQTLYAEEVVLYDNTMFEAKPPPGAPQDAQPPWLTPGDTHIAQQFYNHQADNVSSLHLTIKRTGLPGGRISFEIWDTGEDGLPGKSVGVLSEVEVDSLPTKLETIEIPGAVTGLDPMTRYYLVYRNVDIDIKASGNLDISTAGAQTYHVPTLFEGLNGGPGPNSHPPDGAPLQEVMFLSNGKWVSVEIIAPVTFPPAYIHMQLASECSYNVSIIPSDGGTVVADPELPIYPAGTEVTLTATPNDGYEFTKWLIGESEFTDNPLTLTITGNTQVEPVFERDYLVIDEPDHGSVTLEPAMDFYPVGSDVTVTAAPVDGYEFVKWTYGESELTTNPATITVIEDATLTPIFAEIEEPKPLQVDIEHAVAVSWNSQSDTFYQIRRSMDMETWEVVIDNIAGTGERLTQCFLREETEVFYRVEVAP